MIEDTLFKLLFPTQHKQMLAIVIDRDMYRKDSLRYIDVIKDLNLKVEELEQRPKPKMADLMKEDLGLRQVDFHNTSKTGDFPWLPPHYLDDEPDKALREQYISELGQIYITRVFHKMVEYHINSQGNFSLRMADGEAQILAGRMTINGISLLAGDVKKGYEEYIENHKPEEEFDQFEVGTVD